MVDLLVAVGSSLQALDLVADLAEKVGFFAPTATHNVEQVRDSLFLRASIGVCVDCRLLLAFLNEALAVAQASRLILHVKMLRQILAFELVDETLVDRLVPLGLASFHDASGTQCREVTLMTHIHAVVASRLLLLREHIILLMIGVVLVHVWLMIRIKVLLVTAAIAHLLMRRSTILIV